MFAIYGQQWYSLIGEGLNSSTEVSKVIAEYTMPADTTPPRFTWQFYRSMPCSQSQRCTETHLAAGGGGGVRMITDATIVIDR